jgi:hypothetical protein
MKDVVNSKIVADIFRIDVGGSCLQDVPNTFPLPDGLSGLYELEFDSISHPEHGKWAANFPNNSCLPVIFDHIRLVSALVEANISSTTNEQRLPLSALNYRYVSPLLSMLLCAQDDIETDNISFACHEVFRLAGILYLAEIRRALGVFPVWSTAQLDKLEILFLERQNEINWDGLVIPRLWIVALGAMEATSNKQRELFEFEMKRSIEFIGLKSYEQVEAVLKGFAFIESIHGRRLKMSYDSAMERLADPTTLQI